MTHKSTLFAIQFTESKELMERGGRVLLFPDRASADAVAEAHQLANHGQPKPAIAVVEVEQVLTVKHEPMQDIPYVEVYHVVQFVCPRCGAVSAEEANHGVGEFTVCACCGRSVVIGTVRKSPVF